jgi:hypothetical protein
MQLIFDTPSDQKEPEIVDFDKELLKRVVTQIEARYWLTSEYPTGLQLNEALGTDFKILKAMLPNINAALEKRELPPYDPYRRIAKKDELDPAFVVAVNSLVDISDKRSKAIKLKAVGLTTQKFNILLKSKMNKAYYEARAEEAFGNVQPVAKTSLGKLVDSGDLQAIKYYHEFTGVHDPNRELNTNLNKLIALFMEILIRHVDKEVIDVISREFDVKLLELN